MFEIDLLNSTGLQKHISRIKIQEKGKKQIISFKNLFEKDSETIENPISDSKDSGIISLLLVGCIVVIFFFFGIADYNKTFIKNLFLSPVTNDQAIVYIAELMTNSNDAKSIESIKLDKSLSISMLLDGLDQIKMIETSGIKFSYKIYELSNNSYRVVFSHLLENQSSSTNEDYAINTIIQRYKNDYNVDAVMYNQTLLFTSDDKTIIKILEELIHSGNIRIWPSKDNSRFSLEYTL